MEVKVKTYIAFRFLLCMTYSHCPSVSTVQLHNSNHNKTNFRSSPLYMYNVYACMHGQMYISDSLSTIPSTFSKSLQAIATSIYQFGLQLIFSKENVIRIPQWHSQSVSLFYFLSSGMEYSTMQLVLQEILEFNDCAAIYCRSWRCT